MNIVLATLVGPPEDIGVEPMRTPGRGPPGACGRWEYKLRETSIGKKLHSECIQS